MLFQGLIFTVSRGKYLQPVLARVPALQQVWQGLGADLFPGLAQSSDKCALAPPQRLALVYVCPELRPSVGWEAHLQMWGPFCNAQGLREECLGRVDAPVSTSNSHLNGCMPARTPRCRTARPRKFCVNQKLLIIIRIIRQVRQLQFKTTSP